MKKKWIMKCRLEDVELGSKRKWNSEKDSCLNCPGEQLDQRHLLNCQFLLGKNEILSYIPDYLDIFNGSLEEQIYACRILKENHARLNTQQRTM